MKESNREKMLSRNVGKAPKDKNFCAFSEAEDFFLFFCV